MRIQGNTAEEMMQSFGNMRLILSKDELFSLSEQYEGDLEKAYPEMFKKILTATESPSCKNKTYFIINFKESELTLEDIDGILQDELFHRVDPIPNKYAGSYIRTDGQMVIVEINYPVE